MSLAEGGPARDKMLWGYAEFLTAVQAGDWETAERFVSDESRIGFGPAEGKAGFQEQVVDDAECLKDLVFALKQGCRLDTANQDLVCVAPPQFADPDVLYMGPRVKMIYDKGRESVFVQYLVCGGD
ncbi:hypothetical protein SAMN04515663_102560 [Alcanivorax sp. DSM 26293]|nr:hypothetical protein SAMN04515663_102560 [Alcanivorax sp. DSM 26293]